MQFSQTQCDETNSTMIFNFLGHIFFQLDNIFGHISVTGKGSGQALVQLDYTYAVDQPTEVDFPPVEAFDLDIKATYFGRNNSNVNIRACQRFESTPLKQDIINDDKFLIKSHLYQYLR